MDVIKSKLGLIIAICFLNVSVAFTEETKRNSVVIFLPMAGWIKNKVEFTSGGTKQTISDKGKLYGLDLLYANPKFVIGSLGHYSVLDKTNEIGYLFFTNYYFRQEKQIQPMIGLSVEYINLYTQLSGNDLPPLVSLDVNTRIWAPNPIIGLSYKNYFLNKNADFRISPFVGYFNEQVNTTVSSPGMVIGGQNRFGFKGHSTVNLDYVSVGSKIELTLYHFIKLDSKFYYRFKKDDKTLYTVRNRLDFYLSRRFGFSTKFDYFKDKFETNKFIFFGPAYVF